MVNRCWRTAGLTLLSFLGCVHARVEAPTEVDMPAVVVDTRDVPLLAGEFGWVLNRRVLTDEAFGTRFRRDEGGGFGAGGFCGRWEVPEGSSCQPLYVCADIVERTAGAWFFASAAVVWIGTVAEHVRAVAGFHSDMSRSTDIEDSPSMNWLESVHPLVRVDLQRTLEPIVDRGFPPDPDIFIVEKTCSLRLGDPCFRSVTWACTGEDLQPGEERGQVVLGTTLAEPKEARACSGPEDRTVEAKDFARAIALPPVPRLWWSFEPKKSCGTYPASPPDRCAPLHWCRGSEGQVGNESQEILWIGTDGNHVEAVARFSNDVPRPYFREVEMPFLLGLRPLVRIPLGSRLKKGRVGVPSAERCVVGPVDPCEKRVVYSCWDEAAIAPEGPVVPDPVRVHEVILAP